MVALRCWVSYVLCISKYTPLSSCKSLLQVTYRSLPLLWALQRCDATTEAMITPYKATGKANQLSSTQTIAKASEENNLVCLAQRVLSNTRLSRFFPFYFLLVSMKSSTLTVHGLTFWVSFPSSYLSLYL